MKNNFKIFLLIFLFLNNENILSIRPKAKVAPKEPPTYNIKSSVPLPIPQPIPIPIIKPVEKLNDLNLIISKWLKEIEANIKKTIDPSTEKYIEKNKNQLFHLLFLISLFEHLKKNTLMQTNSEDQKKIDDFNKIKEENENNLSDEFNNNKNEKSLNIQKYSLEIFNLIKRNLVYLRYDEIQKVNWFKKKINLLLNSNDLELLFSDIYHKHFELIKIIINDDESKKLSPEQYKSYSSLLLRNYMIEIINNNEGKSFLEFLKQNLIDLVPFITSKIDHKTNTETKKIILFFDKTFKEICNFIGIKPNIKKSLTDPILTKIKNYMPSRKVLGIAAATAITLGIAYKINNNIKTKNERNKLWNDAFDFNKREKEWNNAIKSNKLTSFDIETLNQWNSLEHKAAKPESYFSRFKNKTIQLKNKIFNPKYDNKKNGLTELEKSKLLQKQKNEITNVGNMNEIDWNDIKNIEYEEERIQSFDNNAQKEVLNYEITAQNRKKRIEEQKRIEEENKKLIKEQQDFNQRNKNMYNDF